MVLILCSSPFQKYRNIFPSLWWCSTPKMPIFTTHWLFFCYLHIPLSCTCSFHVLCLFTFDFSRIFFLRVPVPCENQFWGQCLIALVHWSVVHFTRLPSIRLIFRPLRLTRLDPHKNSMVENWPWWDARLQLFFNSLIFNKPATHSKPLSVHSFFRRGSVGTSSFIISF